MALSLSSITTGKLRKPPRVVLLGVEGVGKSTTAAQSPKTIFIPMKGERGLDEIDAAKFPPCNNYEALIEAITTLYQEDHDYQTVAIDSASALEPLIWDKVCRDNNNAESIEKVNGGYGKGYVEALKLWREVMDGLDALRDEKNMGSILIGHVKTKEFNDPESDPYTTYMFDINEKAANAVYRWADLVAFCNFKRAIVTKTDAGFNKTKSRATGSDQRLMYTTKRPAHPGKNRYALPYELPLSWPALLEAIEKSRGQTEQPAA